MSNSHSTIIQLYMQYTLNAKISCIIYNCFVNPTTTFIYQKMQSNEPALKKRRVEQEHEISIPLDTWSVISSFVDLSPFIPEQKNTTYCYSSAFRR
jgi:hypothetical protein